MSFWARVWENLPGTIVEESRPWGQFGDRLFFLFVVWAGVSLTGTPVTLGILVWFAFLCLLSEIILRWWARWLLKRRQKTRREQLDW